MVRLSRGGADSGGAPMTVIAAIGLFLAIALTVYLFVALLNPEKFE